MSDVNTILQKQRAFFKTGATKSVKFRLNMLKKLEQAVIGHETKLTEALRTDLNKSAFESYMAEIGIVHEEIRYALRHVKGWAAPRTVRTPVIHFPSVSRIYSEPYGIVLIMSPWNYPVQLSLAPLVGAIAAGNCVVLKPSAYSAAVTEAIAEMLAGVFDESYIAVVRGGRDANRSLLEKQFDYIFFTGSTAVGKTVMEAASHHLTPVSLELGGKSPCIVDQTANLRLAAKRIVWGKFLNAGQTCVAPDYILVHESVKERLIRYMEKYIIAMYGPEPCRNPEYPKIINRKHYDRLMGLMKDVPAIWGGDFDSVTHQIGPAILEGITWESPVMQEEIFGPLLPVMSFADLREAAAEVSRHPKPLAVYVFTTEKKRERYLLRTLSFGGGCINDTVVHLVTSHMPFGGIGASGIGGYHGKSSFDTFTHKKSILKKSNLIDIPLRYPPYKNHIRLIKKIM